MKIQSFTVLPAAPPKLKPLLDIAYNMWYAWNPEAANLYKSLDSRVWKASRQNPVVMMCMLCREKLEQAANDVSFLLKLEKVYASFKQYMNEETWFQKNYPDKQNTLIAYFCTEFGLHESLPIYSGGLGVLAGDHVKSASDLGIPLVAIGLLYREGYFRQFLNADGMQTEWYLENDWYSLPVKIVRNADNKPVILNMDMAGEKVYFQTWKVAVGRVTLYLLDTNVLENSEANRAITNVLYDSDREVRIKQEMLLGIGGTRFLHAIGKQPSVFHINEGHSAFLLLERIHQLMAESKLTLEEATEFVWSTTLFTTHTPVPAGNERFANHLIDKYLRNYTEAIGMPWEKFLDLGRENPSNNHEDFCMTVLALKLAAYANGVSALHGKISRNMWQNIFPGMPKREITIGSITNGIHLASWISPHLKEMLNTTNGITLADIMENGPALEKLKNIPAEEFWRIKQARRKVLVRFSRSHIRALDFQRGATPGELADCDAILDPEILTIGFARRFATYKRGDLFLRYPDQIKKLLLHTEHPVQFVLAGKAHPADKPGKEIIQRIFKFAKDNGLKHRIVFLDDYDMNIARHMVQGVDIWLNTPRRPQEASGTSGMKAAINGCLNFSILDGWWDEGYTPELGWVIGHGETSENEAYQDELEGDLLYHILEHDIIPKFYDRNKKGIPEKWVEMMKSSIAQLGAVFNTERMLKEYYEKYYSKANSFNHLLSQDNFQGTRDLAVWKQKLADNWRSVEIKNVISSREETMYAGDELTVTANVKLGSFMPENIRVEVYHGRLNSKNKITKGYRVRMQHHKDKDDLTIFKATIPCEQGGHYGFTVRLLPGHKNLATEFLPGYILWA
ncbi:MAG: alpha-glucan family phosphorylase [Fibrobacteria bacterium]|nr:alpha-glucan family phosphorylase [Fibrobacteria bacterium]